MKRITDKDFRYTPAAKTDIRKTFARIRREQEQERKAAEESLQRIIQIKRASK